ncbi:MAG TPA: CHRD domain-containing protein [Pyrinomonadaceae bacterium]|nr:CHRD domain-containing protein [Pyrinomonadaceae bacterium]
MQIKKTITLFILFAAVSFVLAAQDKEHGGRPMTAVLTGAAEVPGPGDTDGTGTATITLNHGQGQVCYELTVANIGAATAAHIHSGGPTVAGPVVATLDAPAEGTSKGCVNLDKTKIMDIMKNPGNYYINVHNAEFADGAVRGQLSK